MRIGILTFHSQLNYGGVLQCWALQTYLQNCGIDAIVIDRWMSRDNSFVRGIRDSRSVRTWIRFLGRALLFLGDWGIFWRGLKTERFLDRKINRTDFHFYSWKEEAAQTLDVSKIVVGSDQVWSCALQDPAPYLLIGAPGIPAVSYAASFGMRRIPEESLPLYVEGLKKFTRISLREKEGVSICSSLGYRGELVCDPTLLLSREEWKTLLSPAKKHKRKYVFCYFLSEDVDAAAIALGDFAVRTGMEIVICHSEFLVRKMPRNLKELLKNWRFGAWCKMHRVSIASSLSPDEFAREISAADFVVTDSFHAVMFSAIFNRNVRILTPKSEYRKGMFARISDFYEENMSGAFYSDDVASALVSYSRGESCEFNQEKLEAFRRFSARWLIDAIRARKG